MIFLCCLANTIKKIILVKYDRNVHSLMGVMGSCKNYYTNSLVYLNTKLGQSMRILKFPGRCLKVQLHRTSVTRPRHTIGHVTSCSCVVTATLYIYALIYFQTLYYLTNHKIRMSFVNFGLLRFQVNKLNIKLLKSLVKETAS